jgi:hypothetical protein
VKKVLIALLLLPASACTVRGVVIAPSCTPTQRLAIVAQSVPTATRIPCVEVLLPGWSAGGVHVEAGATVFTLNSDRAGQRAARVTLTADCDTSVATRVLGHDEGVERFERSTAVTNRVRHETFNVFSGGCITSTVNVPRVSAEVLIAEAETMILLYRREDLRRALRERAGIDIGSAS